MLYSVSGCDILSYECLLFHLCTSCSRSDTSAIHSIHSAATFSALPRMKNERALTDRRPATSQLGQWKPSTYFLYPRFQGICCAQIDSKEKKQDLGHTPRHTIYPHILYRTFTTMYLQRQGTAGFPSHVCE